MNQRNAKKITELYLFAEEFCSRLVVVVFGVHPEQHHRLIVEKVLTRIITQSHRGKRIEVYNIHIERIYVDEDEIKTFLASRRLIPLMAGRKKSMS